MYPVNNVKKSRACGVHVKYVYRRLEKLYYVTRLDFAALIVVVVVNAIIFFVSPVLILKKKKRILYRNNFF